MPTPAQAAANSIIKRAFDARKSVREIQRDAKVANNTIWRWLNVVDTPDPLTLARVEDALVAAERARANG